MSRESCGYASSKEALLDLLMSSECKCYVTHVTNNLPKLSNGVSYSFVEVTCDNGVQYGLQDYGEEAVKLSETAKEYNHHLHKEEEKRKVPIAVVS